MIMKSNGAVGFWILMVIGILVLLMLFLGQMMSFINYEFTVSLGLAPWSIQYPIRSALSLNSLGSACGL